MEVIKQQAACCVCHDVRIPIYVCNAGCTGVTCGPCRDIPGFDLAICPSCRGKQQRGGTRGRALEEIVVAFNLVETEPAETQAAPALAHAAAPTTAAAPSRPRKCVARATGEAATTSTAAAAAPAAHTAAAEGELEEGHGAGGGTGRGSKRKRVEHTPARRKWTRQQPTASAAATNAASAPATATPAVAAMAATAVDPMKLIKVEQESFYVSKRVWVFFPDQGQRCVGKVARRCEDNELHESEDGSRTCFWEIDFPDGHTHRCSTSDLTQGVMNKLVPPYLVQGYHENLTRDFDAKAADTLMSVRLAGPQNVPAVKVVRDRFLFTNSVVVSVLGGNGMDTFRHPAKRKCVQYLSDQSMHVQPNWNPRMPKHAGCNGSMLLKKKHGMEGMQTIPLFNARGPIDAAKDYNTTRKWEYCGNYTVPAADDDDDAVVIDQVEFVAMGPHLHCPHCNELHSLFQHLSARDVDASTGRFNKIPNSTISFQCPKSAAASAKSKGALKVILVDNGFPIDDSFKEAGTDTLLPNHCVFKKGGIDGGRTAQQKIVNRGALAIEYGLSTYLSTKSSSMQKEFCNGELAETMGKANVQKRRQKYFEILDSGDFSLQWVSFQFKEYDECLYELLCAAEAEHQLNRAATSVNVRSSVARNNHQMVDIYEELRETLITDGCSAYCDGRYQPPQLEVTSGGRLNDHATAK